MKPLAGLWQFASRPDFAGPGRASCVCDGWAAETSDPAEAAIEAYSRRRIDGLRDLIGDWSLALWDDPARCLILASDFAGVRPLYYSLDRTRVLWSSSLAGLVTASGTSDLDERYVAAFLARRPSAGLTPYRGILSVRPGHAVRFAGGAASVERFWDLPAGSLRLAGDRAYEERLLELFHEAVASRVSGHTAVCAELSGGLDSSSVVAVGARIRANITTLSYTHRGAADEPFIRAVEQAGGLPALHLDTADHPFASPAEPGRAAPTWWAPRFRGLAERLPELGATALLTGQLGDLVMGNTLDDSDQVADPLRRFQFRQAAREAYRWSRSLRVPIYPILWRAIRMSLSSWTPDPAADLIPTAWQPRSRETSLTPRLAEAAAGLHDAHEYNWRGAPPDRRRRFRAMAGMLSSRRLQVPEALQSLSYTHPFAHRPLIEFMLSIPPAIVCGPGAPRRLMLGAFRDLLPEAVLRRRSKASFGEVFDRALRPMARAMAQDPGRLLTVEMGYVDRGSLLPRLERYTQGLECNAPQLHAIILFEFWLRSRRT
jgi:asparagine synthase (glutamine-hydrolysing)